MKDSPEVVAFSQMRGDPALLNRLAWRERWANRFTCRERAETVLAMTAGAGDLKAKTERGLAHRTLAWLARWRGDFDESFAQCMKAEALLTERDHPAARGDIYSILGVIHYSRNRLDLARSTVERGILINDKDCPDETMVDLLTTRATIQRYSGAPARAAATLDHARALATGRERARVDHNIARGLYSDGDYLRAESFAAKAINAAIGYQNRVILPYAYEIAGASLAMIDREDEAVQQFRTGLSIAIEDDDRRAQCQIIRFHADIEKRRGNYDHAGDLYRHGLGLCEDLSYRLWQKGFLLALAEVNEAIGDLTAALDNHKAAWAIQHRQRS